MTKYEQLLLFDDLDEVEKLRLEVRDLKKSQDNLRRGLFARYTELCKEFIRVREELEELKKQMEFLS